MADAVKLVLEDGSVWSGTAFGSSVQVCGEVVFNTGMTGYVETLSDPSYKGQILVATYPLIGNYGVPASVLHTGLPHPYESPVIQPLGLAVSSYIDAYSHHAAEKSLDRWLRDCGVPAIMGIDTRGLTRRLRQYGTMRGAILPAGSELCLPADSVPLDRVVPLVSPPGVVRFEAEDGIGLSVMLLDTGAKHNILRSLLQRGVSVVRVPWDFDFAADLRSCDGLFLSNGPGDPANLPSVVDTLRRYLDLGRPVMGICLGHQLLALAAGGTTYKLPYGHRSQNQPVVDLFTRRAYVTSQNHGYAVDHQRLPEGFERWFENVNDGTCEGIRHVRLPWMSVQFHPEAYPGPVDTGWLFDDYIRVLRRFRAADGGVRP